MFALKLSDLTQIKHTGIIFKQCQGSYYIQVIYFDTVTLVVVKTHKAYTKVLHPEMQKHTLLHADQ